ncbi:Kinesin-like protein KIN-14H [Holothuria leucospilota]|uniref:Kinesin-like protein KIN-14H n=1 Tax=Holothuria leucospilota TaxID=206669 RepID=A0A9Q1BYE6_HOLLE|nr:Kinesin-like protein KIN-14H [Holothuria leucospilota]
MEEKIKEELKETLQKTETDLKELERLQLKQNAINEQEKGEGKQLNETIANFMRKIEEKDQKLQNAEVELRSTSEKLKSLASQLQAKDNELKSLISQLKAKDQEIKATKDTLQKTQDTLKAEKTKVREIENKLKLSEENLTAAKSEIKNLSRSQELFQRQQRSKVLEGKDNYSIFCRIKTTKRKTDSFITRKDEVLLKTTGIEYKYSFIFPENATREDIFARLEDLVQNAIDGGKSAILMHGNSPEHNMYVMYGNEVDEGIVFKTIHKIFYVSKKWTNIGYVAEVNASFAKLLPGKESHFTFSTLDGKPKDNTKYIFTNDDLAVKGLKVSVPTEETAISFLKKYTETQTKTDGKQLVTNDFVQFFITTKFQSEEVSTGTLTFVLYNDVEALKDCFKSHNKTPLFPHYFASMINAEGSKVRILSNIEEDKKEEAKEHLKFSNWIVQEKSSFTTRFKEKLGFAS